MNEKYKPEYVESDLPPDQHEHQGWFWHMASKKFYRWNDLPHRKDAIIKKDTLAVKTATEKRAVLKDNLANDKTVKELLTMLQEVTK